MGAGVHVQVRDKGKKEWWPGVVESMDPDSGEPWVLVEGFKSAFPFREVPQPAPPGQGVVLPPLLHSQLNMRFQSNMLCPET